MTRIRLATFCGDQGIEAFNREMAEHREQTVCPATVAVAVNMAVIPLSSSFAEIANRFRKIMTTQTTSSPESKEKHND